MLEVISHISLEVFLVRHNSYNILRYPFSNELQLLVHMFPYNTFSTYFELTNWGTNPPYKVS